MAGFSSAWLLVGLLCVLIGLLGYAYKWRWWQFAVIFLGGATLAMHSQVDRERLMRDDFWLRNAKTYERNVGAGVSNCLWQVKRDLSRRIGIGLDYNLRAANLNRAILLGERQRLPRDAKRTFVEAGTMHIFAISGLHVMLVANVLLYLCLLTFIPVRWVGLVSIPLLWLYIGITGFPPSAVRAGMMASFYYAAPWFFRRSNLLVSWCLTFIAVHLVAPAQLFNVGSALSFVIMLSIALWCRFGPRLQSKLVNCLGVTAVTWIASVPIAAHVFGRVTPGGLIANLIVLPTAAYSVSMGAIGIVVSYISESLAAHFNNLSAMLTELMMGMSTVVASMPWANFEVSRWSVWLCVEWYLLFALGIYLIHSIYRRRHVF